MNRKTLFLVCLSFIPVILSSPPYVTNNGKRTAPIHPRTPKSFDIDLDASYEEQWKSIIVHFGPQILLFVQSMGLNTLDLEVLDLIDYPIVEAYDNKLALELKALSKLVNLSFTELFLLNLYYDITAQCTSILIQDPDGNVIHGRNLDFPFAPELSKMIFYGRYFRNGELAYEALSLAGYAGLITAMKPNAYSFSIDQYLLDANSTSIVEQVINAALDIIQAYQKKLSPPLVAKRAFETIYDFKDFVEFLNSTDTVSRVFYIVAGALPGEGAVITKFRASTENITYLNPNADGWYVIQTNYIGDEPDPLFDDRATAAEDWLNSIGQSHITKELLFSEVMSIYPIFNNQTIHTTIMQPNNGYLNTTIWGW